MIQLWAVKIMQLLYEIMIVVKNFCGVCFLNDKQGVPDLSGFGDDVYQLGFGLGADQPPTSAIVKQELQRKIIYQMSPQEVINFATIVDTAHPLATYLILLMPFWVCIIVATAPLAILMIPESWSKHF